MLVLTRETDEEIYRIQEGVPAERLLIVDVGREVKIGISAPRDVKFVRPEYLTPDVIAALRSGAPVSTELLAQMESDKEAYRAARNPRIGAA